MNNQCPEREDGADHCWHPHTQPHRNPSGSVIFQNVCCFCAPVWMQLVVFNMASEAQVSNEDMVAEQMRHGRLIRIERAPKRGPQLTLIGR